MRNFTSDNLECKFGVPSIKVFWRYLTGTKLLIFIVPLIFCMLTIWIYSKNLRSLMSNCPLVIRTHCLVLVSIYPIVSLFSLTAIAIPRTYFFNDSAGHIAFMVISWHLYRLCIIYVDGEKNFISTSGDEAFTLKSPPLCCCLPLNRVPMTKSSSKFVKFLIIQMPITHILIFVVLNIIYIEDINAFDDLILYFIPFIALTVLGGIWGYNLVVRTLSPYYPNLKLIQKYFAFQLVLFFCKIFPILMNFIMKMIITSCYGPLTIVVKRHIIIQIQVQIQMFILSLWAMRLYKDPMMK